MAGSVEPFARTTLLMKLTAAASGVAVPLPKVVVPALAPVPRPMSAAYSDSVGAA
ncbi:MULTISPECIES: hypothetical protein [unclassified Methylobacterium]|uniref:hypothetical protein n=1 Tax=unclassified Methylobacterium TaxID=2615210 RepID=UPI001FEE9503|nr:MULTISPECIES: hypothetical protein [unclassified Methylobacterium]